MSALEKNLLTQESVASIPDSNLTAVRSALVADVLGRSDDSHYHNRQTKIVRLSVYGESMLPSLWPGDVVEIASCSLEDVRPGEIVLALRNGRLFLHRLIRTRPEGFVLRGDSMPGPDPLFPGEALLGRLVSCAGKDVAAGGSLKSTSRDLPGARLSRAVGVLLCHWRMARSLALNLHRRRKSYAHARESENRECSGNLTSAEYSSTEAGTL